MGGKKSEMSNNCDKCGEILPEKPYEFFIKVQRYYPKPTDEPYVGMRKSYCSFDCCKEVLDRICKAIE